MVTFEHPDFEVLQPLGRGAQALVFRARQRTLDRSVAIKVLRDATDTELISRLLREAKLIAGLKHPNLVQIYDAGTLPDGRPYVVMECVDGPTLQQRMKRPLPPLLALRIVAQVAGALGVAHMAGIVHRDVKPANILLDGTDDKPQAKLADFGVARPSASDLTEVGTAVGTPAYMAPESFHGEVTPPGDVYALGMLAYELLAGQRPYNGSNAAEWMFHHLSTAPPPLPAIPGLPEGARELVARMLEKDPGQRIASGSDVEALLARILNEPDPTLAIGALSPSPPTRSMRGAMVVVGALTTVAVLALLLVSAGVGAGAWMAMDERDQPVPTTTPAATAPAPAPATLEPAPPPLALEVDPEPPEPMEAQRPPVAAPQAPETPRPIPGAAEPEREPDPVPVPEAEVTAAPTFSTGTYKGTAAGRPLVLVMSGTASAPRLQLTLTVGESTEEHLLVGQATPMSDGWVVDLAESGGGWAVEAELTNSRLTGVFTINGKRRTPFEARK